jgi:hypothetical protein
MKIIIFVFASLLACCAPVFGAGYSVFDTKEECQAALDKINAAAGYGKGVLAGNVTTGYANPVLLEDGRYGIPDGNVADGMPQKDISNVEPTAIKSALVAEADSAAAAVADAPLDDVAGGGK